MKDKNISREIKYDFRSNFFIYIAALVYNFLNKKFDDSNVRGTYLEEYRKKILVAERVREFDHILQKMNELEIIKTLLFNEYQKASLLYLKKPKNTNIEIFKKYNTNKDIDVMNLEGVENYFSKVLCEQDGNLNERDEFLFLQLDDKIQQSILKKSLKIKI